MPENTERQQVALHLIRCGEALLWHRSRRVVGRAAGVALISLVVVLLRRSPAALSESLNP